MGVACTEILPHDSKLCIIQSGGLLRCFFVMHIWTSSLALSAVHVTPVILWHLVFEADPVQLLSVSSKFQKSSLSAAVCQALCYDLGTHREMRESYLWRLSTLDWGQDVKTDDYRGHTQCCNWGTQKAGLVCDSFRLGIKEGFRQELTSGVSPGVWVVIIWA